MWKAEYKDAAVDSPQGLWFANPGGSNSIPSRTHSSVQRTRSLPVHTTPQTMVMFQQSGKEGAQRPRFPRSHLHFIPSEVLIIKTKRAASAVCWTTLNWDYPGSAFDVRVLDTRLL